MTDLFFLPAPARREAFQALENALERYGRSVDSAPIAPVSAQPAVTHREALVREEPTSPAAVLEELAEGLTVGQTHVSARRYFGLFNPATSLTAALADALVGGFNPQLATVASAPFAAEVEARTIADIARELGYPHEDGHFTSGGAEANATAVLAALTHVFPNLPSVGLRGLDADPTIYVSAEAHHSIHKAARMAGLGDAAVRVVPMDVEQRLRVDRLHDLVHDDLRNKKQPVLFVVTLGTTSAGTMEPIAPMLKLARTQGAWLHVDAAFGGLLAFADPKHPALERLGEADSLTFDAHKTLHVPMGAGAFMTRHAEALRNAFHLNSGYMPHVATHDAFARSMQWSRRFIGAKVHAAIAGFGWREIRRMARHMLELGTLLKTQLSERGFRLFGSTPLPIAAFQDEARGRSPIELCGLASERANAWLSVARLSSGNKVARACVCHARTEASDVEALVNALA